jgi:hypothetical protein
MMEIEGKYDRIDDRKPTTSRGWARERGFHPWSPARGCPRFVTLGRAMALVVVAAFFALSMAVQASGAWQGQSDQAQAYLPPESSCKDFVAAETIVWSANRYWLGGYLSAYNMLSRGNGNVGGGADYEAMIQWLVDRCTAEPTLSFLDATTALIRALEQRNP